MNVTPAGAGYRIEMVDGTYAYVTSAEAARLHDNLGYAIRAAWSSPVLLDPDDNLALAFCGYKLDADGRIVPE